MKKNSFSEKTSAFFVDLKPADISLMLFMAILLLQSFFTLFFKTKISDVDKSLDVIFRTSIASVFGYFLSANFASGLSSGLSLPVLNAGGKQNEKQQPEQDVVSSEAVDVDITLFSQDVVEPKKHARFSIEHQIVVTTVIGISCLVALIIYRNFVEASYTPGETISQIRDLLSGCLGYLLGIPNAKE